MTVYVAPGTSPDTHTSPASASSSGAAAVKSSVTLRLPVIPAPVIENTAPTFAAPPLLLFFRIRIAAQFTVVDELAEPDPALVEANVAALL